MDIENEEQEFRLLLSQNIKKFRAKLGLSQLGLSLELNISPTFLCDVETGKKWASPKTLVRIAKALGVKPYELFIPEEPHSSCGNFDTLQKCLDDVQLSVKLSLRQTIEKTVEESIATVREYYLVRQCS